MWFSHWCFQMLHPLGTLPWFAGLCTFITITPSISNFSLLLTSTLRLVSLIFSLCWWYCNVECVELCVAWFFLMFDCANQFWTVNVFHEYSTVCSAALLWCLPYELPSCCSIPSSNYVLYLSVYHWSLVRATYCESCWWRVLASSCWVPAWCCYSTEFW